MVIKKIYRSILGLMEELILVKVREIIIYIDNVQCNGSESHLEECPSSDVGDHDCSHSEDAGVSCQGTGSMRLYCICMQDHFLCGLFLKHSICS